MTVRIKIQSKQKASRPDILRSAVALGIHTLTNCTSAQLYFLATDPGDTALEQLCTALLCDPVTEVATWGDQKIEAPRTTHHAPRTTPHTIEVSFRPGVTDVAARELQRAMVEIGLPSCEVATATRFELEGDLSDTDLRKLARGLLCNETIQHFTLGEIDVHFGSDLVSSDRVEIVPVRGLGDAELQALSKRRLLSLDLAEMKTVQTFYSQLDRDPTDVELETLAQTWSEHCVHKTFKAQIDFTWFNADGSIKQTELIDGLLRQYIRAATDAVYPAWLKSAFVDNAGIIAFDDHFDLAFKVETHNHPSALEPFGGANTGVGGVVRDIIGVSARPIATTDVLCFGPQNFPHADLPAGILHPARIAEGVVAGIGDYGNKLGLPTVNGAVIYDEGYLGNPLVFCGCVGLLPIDSHVTQAKAGDLVVALGGRTGRDGIHGATFSSAELAHDTVETAGSAVQIGDPITEKGLIEVIESARDRGLYTAITDCGAGGFSSAVGEMGKDLGVDIELTNAPLKYPGLAPWEIWISEAQERIVIAVEPSKLDALRQITELWDVELCVLGTFTGDGDLRVRHKGQIVAEMPMEFLHDGLPRRRMKAVWQERQAEGERGRQGGGTSSKSPISNLQSPVFDSQFAIRNSQSATLLRMLAHPTIASKEAIVRKYDHEVRGGTLVRPFVGPQMDGPSDAAVLKPLGTWDNNQAFALSVGINPCIGQVDPYAMAVSAIDEAVRNAVAVGADPDRIAILDNFCWGNPTYPDRLGALVRCCQGCYDAALAYHTPFISGKDSLYNEFNGQPIPGTLLISAIGLLPDMNRSVTSNFKTSGNLIYLLGETRAELGGSLLHQLEGIEGGTAPTLPADALPRYRQLHAAIRAGRVQACHDLSEGGLAVALAEMCIAGRLGATVEIGDWRSEIGDWEIGRLGLFSESNGRLLLEVAPGDAREFETILAGQFLQRIGFVQDEMRMLVSHGETALIDLPVEQLVAAWKHDT